MYTERLAETSMGMPRMFRLFGANMFAGLGTSMFVKKYLIHSSVLQEIRPAPPSTNDRPRKSGIFFIFLK